ncbi:MAG: type IX secretion system PorP/SprF family membrane protein [Flavobacteriales bacterium]|jgi:type IX secretion system PorP/SprF family membrane protein
MKRKLLQLVILICPALAFGQQDPMISQYMFTGTVLNPAYVGSHENTNATALYRYQWAGISTDNGTDDLNPRTALFSLDGKLKNENLGWGIILGNDQFGVSGKTDVVGNLAYHLGLGKGTLSFGLRSGLSFYNADLTSVKLFNGAYDPAFASNGENQIMGNVGAGAYYYAKKFYLGVSVPHTIENTLVSDKSTLVRHYYAHTGVVLEVNENFAIKPSILMKYVEAAPVEFDLNLNFLIGNVVWIGGSYRTGDSFVGMIELQANKNLRVGYAYDKMFTELDTFSTGSHEFMLSWCFGVSQTKMKSPRYF